MSQDRSNNMESDWHSKLSGFEMNPPMEVLERIHQKRSLRHKTIVLFNRRWPVYVAVFLNLLAIMGHFNSNTFPYEINALPIPLAATAQLTNPTIPEFQSSNSSKTALPSHQTASESTDQSINSNNHSDLSFLPNPPQKESQQQKLSFTPKRYNQISIDHTPILTFKTMAIRNWPTPSLNVPSLSAINIVPLPLPFDPVAIAMPKPTKNDILPSQPTMQSGKLSAKLALEFSASTFSPIRHLEAFNESYQPYLDLRKDAESPKLGYGQQILFDIGLDNGIHLKTGLAFSTIVGDFYYFNDTEKQLVIEEVKAPDGSILRADTSYAGVITEQSNNRMHSLDIPIMVSFQKNWKKFEFGIQTGTFLNLDFWQNGQTIDQQTLRPVPFEEASHAQSIRRIGGNYFASIRLGYAPSQTWSFYMEPHARYYPNFFNDPSYVLKQKYWWPGISVGTRLQLN